LPSSFSNADAAIAAQMSPTALKRPRTSSIISNHLLYVDDTIKWNRTTTVFPLKNQLSRLSPLSTSKKSTLEEKNPQVLLF